MNRSDFLKRLGIGAAAVIVAPQVLKALPEKPVNVANPATNQLTCTLKGSDLSCVLIRYNEVDSNNDIYLPGCFGNSIDKYRPKYIPTGILINPEYFKL